SLFRLCSDCLILGHLLSFLFFFISLPPAPRSTLFPYTTLFRSALALWEFRGLSGQMGYLAPTWLLYPLGVYFTFSGTLLKNIDRSEEHTSELQSRENLVCRLLLEKKKTIYYSARLTSTRTFSSS